MNDQIYELTEDVSGSPYWNRDIAPSLRQERKWVLKDIAALWISMSACVPGFLDVIHFISAPPFFRVLYHYAWFVSFSISFISYLGLMRLSYGPLPLPEAV